MKALFWFCAVYIAYTYIGYPVLLFFWSRLFPRRVKKLELSVPPTVSIVIAARNAGATIARRLENLFAQDYPAERLEIIVASDGSTDSTNDILWNIIEPRRNSLAESLADPRVHLIEIEQHQGKPHALNCGVNSAKGEIIVFADSRQEFSRGAIRQLVANFSDPSVGCVSGELTFYEGTDTRIETEMGAYWNYEKRIRKMEGMVHSAAGATGAIYAIRRSLFAGIPEETILDDVFVPMQVVFEGYRTVFESDAIAYDTISENFSYEKKRKVRTLLGNYQLIQLLPWLLNPFRNTIFIQFLSHKVLRLFVPFVFVLLMVSSLLIDGLVYRMALVLCGLVLISPFIGLVTSFIPLLEKFRKIAQTFVFLNSYAALAFVIFVSRKQKDVW